MPDTHVMAGRAGADETTEFDAIVIGEIGRASCRERV